MAKRLTRQQKLAAQNQTANVVVEMKPPKFFENKKLFPKNYNQEDALYSLNHNTLTILTGPPGTAKTLLSAYTAVEMLENRQIDKIYYVKPIVQVVGQQGIGFLPGDTNEKTAPHFASMLDALCVFMPKTKANYYFEKQIIEFLPIEHLRGRSLNNCYVIADEAQNTIPSSILTVLTRLGQNSKMALIGDIVQRDLNAKFGRNGLSDALHRLRACDGVGHIEFSMEDICRSTFVKNVISMYADLYEVA